MRHKNLRIVFDTNVYLSAFNWEGGKPERAYRSALKGVFVLVTSPPIIAETARKLREKFFWEEERIVQKVKEMARKSEIIQPKTIIDAIKDDESDNRILECAIEGKANLIVSRDKHLRRLNEYEGIAIIGVNDLLHIIEKTK